MFKINTNSKYSRILNDEKEKERAKMHSFHRYYGKLIPAIPSAFIQEFTQKGDWVFDPFTGSGTTAVESKKLQRNFLGVEINPLSAEIARVKTTSLDIELLETVNNEIIRKIEEDRRDYSDHEKPYITNREHWFKEFVQEDLLKIQKNINEYFAMTDKIDCGEIDQYRNFYLIVLSAIIKNASNADTRHVFPGVSKRMRALEAEGKINIDVLGSYKRALKSRTQMFDIYENKNSAVEIIEGDSSLIDLKEYSNKMDLIVTNPPYISSVRYIETLKLEMYWLEEIKSPEEYKKLGDKMIGNDRLHKHEYETIGHTGYKEINDIIDMMQAIDKKSAKIIEKYFKDMEKVIINMSGLLKENKKAVLKISDSKMKRQKIETGKLLTIIAEANGFKLKDVFLDKINNNSRTLTTYRNTYSDIITHDYIVIWEKMNVR
ncbi:MAG: DNA methyltransferase [Saccharofermentanales bacterium]